MTNGKVSHVQCGQGVNLSSWRNILQIAFLKPLLFLFACCITIFNSQSYADSTFPCNVDGTTARCTVDGLVYPNWLYLLEYGMTALGCVGKNCLSQDLI